MATNHTSFFREPQHFAYVQSSILPQVRARRVPVPLKVWSMPCSTGEEPYSLAISLLDGGLPSGFTVLASDLSTKIDRADLGHRFDVICCRNLLIYFDEAA